MGESNKNSTTSCGARAVLGEVLPLKAPYLIHIFPVYGCNFRCGYCIHSLDRRLHGYISNDKYMPIGRFCKCIDDIKKSGWKIKMLSFAGIGEPFLHPQIAEMISYASKAGIADSIEIVTNGALLTKDLSDKLIAAGLSKLRISLEGLSAEDYFANSASKIDFEKFLNNIRYFYENRGNTKMYIKIIDYMVQTKERQDIFFKTFTPMTDDIAIEHLTPTIKEINFDSLSGGMKNDKPKNGEELLKSNICPQPFYMMLINPDGNVVPCCSMKYPCIIGNVDKNSVEEIWLGNEYNSFRRKLLTGVDKGGIVCAECSVYLYNMYKEDMLDDYASGLLQKYN